MSRTTRVLADSVHGMARNRVRTFFMMLGTFVGVCALTVMMAIGRGTQRDMMEKVERMLGGASIYLRAGGSRMVGGAHSGGLTTTLTLEDVRAIDDELEQVELADPMLSTGRRDVVYGNMTRSIRIEGHSEAAEVVSNRSVTRGAYFTPADVVSAARVALVGEVVVRELFAGRDAIGEQIRIGTVPFKVVGVLEPIGMDPHGIDKDNEIIIPITTLMRRLLNVDYIMAAHLGLRRGADVDATVLEVEGILRRRHALAEGQLSDFAMFTPMQARHMVRSANRVFTVFLPLVAAVSILVGGLVVANLMLMAVSERRSEIGLRKAIGARSRDIRLQFLMESAAITGLGGLFAIGAAFVILQALTLHGATSASMPWAVVALGFGASVGTGIVSGILPARRAADLDPVQTLR